MFQCQAQWLVCGRYMQPFLNEFYIWGRLERGNVYILEFNGTHSLNMFVDSMLNLESEELLEHG